MRPLGKRMGSGWYQDQPLDLTAFFDNIEDNHWDEMDDFELIIEDSERGDCQLRADWKYEDYKIVK